VLARRLGRNKRIVLHLIPTSGCWLNMVEIFFGVITHQAIRRGTLTSVEDLIAPSASSATPGTNAANRSSGPDRRRTNLTSHTRARQTSTARHQN
jgi:hypothetical protein